MKTIATLVSGVLMGMLITLNLSAQPVNTHRAFTWDGWPANSLSQPNFITNLGPDNVNVGLTFAFSGTPSANTAATYTYANQSGRISSLKVEKLPGSEDTLTATLSFNKNLEGFNMEINPYNCSYVVVMAYNLSGTRVHLKGVYDISYTDPVTTKGDTITGIKKADMNVYFDGPVSKVIYKVVKTNASSGGIEFAVGAASWFNSAAYTPNPDLAYNCEGNEVMLILDASTSIDATERSQLVTAIESMLNSLQYYGINPNYISIVEFSQQARLALDYTMVTPASIAPGGAIYNYLHNVNGDGYYYCNSLYGGYTNWSQAFKVALAKARARKPNLLIFFTDGAPNRIYEPNTATNANLLYSASWGVNRTGLYADTLKQMGTHILGVGVDRINTTTQDFYFRYPIEMANPIIYDYLTPPPSNISVADYVTVAAFPYLEQVFNNLFVACIAALPVQFSSVNVKQQGCVSNQVTWQMEQEDDAVSYQVQRSFDGQHYEVLESLPADNQPGAGTYTVTDNDPSHALIYYRVEAKMKSGKSILSSVVTAQSTCTVSSALALWPNPVKGGNLSVRFTSAYSGSLTVQLFDVQGRKIKEHRMMKAQPVLQISENVQQLPNGFYTLAVVDNNNRLIAQQKFIR